MIHAGVGLSAQQDAHYAALEATRAALAQAGSATAHFALVFATTAHGANYSLLLRTVREVAQARDVVGCSAGGVLTLAGEIERAPAVAVLVVSADTLSSRRFFVPQLRGHAYEVGEEVGKAARPSLGTDNLLVMFPDTYNFHPVPFFAGLARAVPHLPVVGGGASEDGTIGETFQFCGDTVGNNAVSGILLSGHFSHTVAVSQSCQPISPVYTVTKAQGNVIYELDGRLAFTVFTEVVRPPLLEDLRRAAAFVLVGLPVDPAAPHLASGEYVVRHIIGFDPPQGAIAVAEEVRPGQRLLFTLRDATGARADLKRTLAAQAEQWQGRSPAFGLYFNCVGRGSGLYGFPDHDTSYIKQYLGEFPLIGFFTGCEIAPVQRRSALHQYSGVLTLIGE